MALWDYLQKKNLVQLCGFFSLQRRPSRVRAAHHRRAAHRSLASQTANKKSLWDMGLHIFRAHLDSRPEVARKTVQGLLTLIETERCGEQVNK